MATYDLEEQEQLDSLKAWWRQYGDWITGVLLVVSLSFAGYQGWNWYQRNQSAEASALFASLQQAANLEEDQRVRAAAGELLEKYSSTRYAEMGAMISARVAFEAGDRKTAQAQLQWVVDHADSELRDLARLRLTAVLLEDGNVDAALATVAKPDQASFAPRFAEVRGDILLVQGKRAEARTAYEAALAAMPTETDASAQRYRELLKQKRDALAAVK
ncbi:MAG TPA: tetratricopeptide repeat protein [Rhodocyclaceae bacterium]